MLSKQFTGIFTYNFEDYNDPLDPRYRYSILKDLLKGEKDIRWISATALPSIPLNSSILEGIDYYILPNVSEIESLFKYLNTQDKGVVILDNFDHLLSNNTHNSKIFFQWIFESMKKKETKIVFFAHGWPSDQVDSEGRRKVRAPWHYLMVYHGKNYSIKLNHIWLLRTPGYSQENMDKKTFVRMIFTPSIIKDISGLEIRVLEITDKIKEIPRTKNADIYTRLIQRVWLTHSKRYEYNPINKQLTLEHNIVKLEPFSTYKKSKSMTHAPKKAVNVIKYVIKQKSFAFIDKKKYNFRISTFDSTEKLCHTFVDDLQIIGDLKNKIIDKSGDVLWLIPFLAIFTYHFKDIHGIEPEEALDNCLKYPQIKNWFGGKNIKYFKVFDAKKIPPLAKRLAASIHPIDTLFNLPIFKVDELLDAGKNCTLILYDLTVINYLTLKLEGIRDIYSYSNSPITFKEDWSSKFIDEIDEEMIKMSTKHVFQGRLVDLRPVDDFYISDTTDLTFEQITIYVESLRILIKIGIVGDEIIWNVTLPQEK